MASRHLSRISVLQALFAADVYGDLSCDTVTETLQKNTAALPHEDEDAAFSLKLVRGITVKRSEIDAVIRKAAPQWPIEKIAAVDRNILRIGLFELLFGTSISVPPKVALNEAIELAKTFGGDSSGRFINGVLGAVYRDMGSPRKEEAPEEKKHTEVEHLAGVMVCSFENDTLYVALVLDPFNVWTLPKTHYQGKELSDGAAVRVAQEELGIELKKVTAPIGEHEYTAHDPDVGVVTRRVGYFVACSAKTPLRIQKEENVTDAQWFTAEELESLDCYEDLRGIMNLGMVVAQQKCI
ncbi:MAG: transcription antitermination factor NusB [Patescibacteria group bacterium UBA2163]